MEKLFEGAISSKAILENKKRKIQTLYLDKAKKTNDIRYLYALCKQQGIKVRSLSKEKISSLANGHSHGGILLEANDRKFDLYTAMNCQGISAYIDGLEDPYNFGSVCRTLYASGINTLLIPKRDWSACETIIMKASAGAYEKMDIYHVDDETAFVEFLKANDCPLICAHRKDAISLYDYNFSDRFVLAVGGPFRGLSATITSNSSQNVVIPYANDFRNALDTPSAMAVMAFEIMRQGGVTK